jgi:hypothetical protein
MPKFSRKVNAAEENSIEFNSGEYGGLRRKPEFGQQLLGDLGNAGQRWIRWKDVFSIRLHPSGVDTLASKKHYQQNKSAAQSAYIASLRP